VLLATAALISACADGVGEPEPVAAPVAAPSVAVEGAPAATGSADVLAVSASGAPGAYTFSVTVGSPDSGCQRFADWWEVLSEDGELLYRRILLHSHVDEQPFTRSGGPVPIDPAETVLVRAHMSTEGYGVSVMRGSVEAGFEPAQTPAGFAGELASEAPLPQDCAF